MSEESTYVSYGSVDYDITFPEVPSPCPSSEYGWSYKDEILLDPDDRPLELAVNSKSPLTFHLVTGCDRNSELLKNLRSESFTPEQRRRLIEKFNLSTENEGDDKSSVTSSPSTPRRRTSLSGSSHSGSWNKFAEVKQRAASPRLVAAMAKLNGLNEVGRKSSLKQTNVTPVKPPPAPATRSNTLPRPDKPISLPLPLSGQTPTSMRSGRVRNVKNKKDSLSGSRREPRSASARKLFLSLRKYRARSSSRDRSATKSASNISDAEDATSPSKLTELSSDANLPGILKIFGDAVSPGANYKSVMATKHSSARELVKMALERYGIARQQARYHVLCEVVGRISEEEDKSEDSKALKVKTKKSKRKSAASPAKPNELSLYGNDFVEDYVRPLSDHEKPLILQSYWKPLDGHCRRFEIRRRSKVFKKGEKDHATRDVNMQARRLVLQKSRNNLHIESLNVSPQTDTESDDGDSDSGKITSFDVRRPTHAEQDVVSKKSDLSDVTTQNSPEPTPTDSPTADVANGGDDVTSGNDVTYDDVKPVVASGTTHNAPSPDKVEHKVADSPPCPYLITLQGNEDNLIHSLDKHEILIGSDVTDFKLVAPDVLRHHCVIRRRLEILFSESDNYEALKRWCVTITPLNPEADVTINGVRITSKYALQHGELVSIGKRHMFMYKDPSSHVSLSNAATSSLLNQIPSKDPDVNSTEAQSSELSLKSEDPPSPPELAKVIETDFTYEQASEDRVLAEIFGSFGDFPDLSGEYALTPATILCQCIIHSCLNFDLQHKNDILLKIASNLQTLVLNATRSVSVQEIQSISDANHNVHIIHPTLRPVVFWMSNSLEIFEFLQKDLIPIIQKRVQEEREKNLVEPGLLSDAESFAVNEEILALLEEVVMYAFQQLVYYLTKTLYGSLPAILECNPFAEEAGSALCVSHVTNVYTCANEMTRAFDVNERISDQLFAYLFFFTNVSLFNTLMEDDSSSKYYRWEMGVRIRGNLETIESWAADNGYMGQCSTYLEKISSLANLLATPRGQFMKSTWPSFRENFPALTPAQLKQVLNGYQIPGKQVMPKSWAPDIEEMDDAFDDDAIMESYDNHPPLMLPVSGSKINFRVLPDDPWFAELHQRLKGVGTSLQDDVIVDEPVAVVRDQANARAESMTSPKRDVITNDGTPTSPTKSGAGLERKYLSPETLETASPAIPSPTNQSPDTEKRTETASLSGGERIVSSSSCSSCSEPEAYVIRQHKSPHQQRKLSDVIMKPSDAINDLVESEDRGKACDELLLLPVSETTSLTSHVSSNKSNSHSPSSGVANAGNVSPGGSQGMPKEVFIVDIKKGKTGLGVGLVDGVITSLGVPGIFVRSLIPDGPSTKHSHTRHHDVVRCWLQEGRLQLGDRILAANGVSLINMSYYEAMRTVRQAGDNVRLLVGRCGPDVAMKITSSSC